LEDEYVAVCCRVLHRTLGMPFGKDAYDSSGECVAVYCCGCVLQTLALWRQTVSYTLEDVQDSTTAVLQHAAVCCSVLQCIALC